MNIKNHTSSVPVDQSILSIERMLVQAGATQIAKTYNSTQEIIGLRFQLPVNGVPMIFNLPCETKPFEDYLLAQYKKLTPAIESKVRAQAGRTAWKMLYERVYIEVSYVVIARRNPLEIFLSYLWDPRTNKTYFQKLSENNFKQLTAGMKSDT